MFESPEHPSFPENYNYAGLWDRLQPKPRSEVAHAFLEIVYMGSGVLMGADAHRGLFSESTSRIMAGMDPNNPPDSLYEYTPDGSGPGSVAWDEAMAATQRMLDPELTDRPDDPEGDW